MTENNEKNQWLIILGIMAYTVTCSIIFGAITQIPPLYNKEWELYHLPWWWSHVAALVSVFIPSAAVVAIIHLRKKRKR